MYDEDYMGPDWGDEYDDYYYCYGDTYDEDEVEIPIVWSDE